MQLNRKRLRASGLILCFLLSPLLLPAQVNSGDGGPYVHKTWTTEDGLPQNSITSILQTREGYVWLGTLGGLARFDGVAFTVFNTVNTPGLKSDRVRALYEDAEGSVWIGTEHGGLTRYHAGVFTQFSEQDGLPSNTILSLTGDSRGVWVGSLAGVAREQSGTFATETQLPRTAITAIYEDPQQTLWLGAEGVGLIHSTPQKTTTYTARDGLAGEVTAIHEGPHQEIWVGTSRGLSSFHEGRFALVVMKPQGSGAVRAILPEAGEVAWVATERDLYRFADGRFTPFLIRGANATNLLSIFVDREKNLWVGSDGGGLDRWRRSNVTVYTAAQGLTNRPTLSILQQPAGTIWIGALGGGSLFVSKGDKFAPYPHHGSQLESPGSLAFDHSNNLWLGDWRYGLIRLAAKTGQWGQFALPGRSHGAVRSLYVDSQNTLWVGTDQAGLYRIKEGGFANYRVSDGLLSDSVNLIAQDRQGAIWLGTPAGLSRFENGHFRNYQSPGLFLVRSLHEDSQGSLWIGTYGNGLFRLKQDKFVRITSSQGLYDDVVSAILEDAHGNFWMSGNRGIFRVSWADLNDLAEGRNDALRCVSYGVSDGMVVSETNGSGQPDGLRAQDGKLWFPMVAGAVAIDPELTNALPPPVVIERVNLDGATLPVGQPIRIKPGQRDLEIHYAALTFRRAEQAVFRYRMAGVDSNWVDAGTRRTAYFSVLSPGSYTFKVIADNGEGVWNESGQVLQIEVLPPFWSTWWFRALIALCVIALATLAYRLRAVRWARAHAAREAFARRLLASEEAERKRIAAELHDSLGQSLLIIKNRAVLALSALPDTESAREQLEEISAGASGAVEEVREISYKLRPYQLDRFGLSMALRALCARVRETTAIHVTADVDDIDGVFPEEAEIGIYRIVQELLNNIIKHSQADDAALVVRRDGEGVLLTIHDNGRGFAVNGASSGAHKKREGFGLIGIAERARMLKGTCDIESPPLQGTTITIRLPVSGPIRGGGEF